MLEPAHLYLFGKAFVLTNIVEIPVVLYILHFYFRLPDRRLDVSQIVASTFIGNMATTSYLWFVFPVIFPEVSTVILMGEFTALLTEAFVYYSILRVRFPAAVLASVIANTLSVLVGLLLMPPW